VASKSGWLVVVAAFFGVMAGFGSLVVFTFGVFLKPVSSEFGWSREAVSRGFGFAALAVAVASPKLGQLLDRLGPRKVILPCYAVYAVALMSLAFLGPHLAQFYAIFIILGLIGNATTQMGYSRAVSTWFDRRRGLALALVMAGTGVGSIVLPAFAQWLIDAHGWRAAYETLGIMALICGIPLTFLFVQERPQASTAGSQPASGSTTVEGLRSRAFWTLVAILFLNSVSVNGAITHLFALLTDRGISARDAAMTLSVLGAASLCGRLMTGMLLDRFFGPRVSFFLLAGVATGIAMLASARHPASALVAAALIGLGLGAEADITPYLLTRYFGLRSFSTLYGFTWTAYAIAGAIGPVVMGRAFDLTGSYESFLSILACATLLSAFLMLTMPRYERVPPPEFEAAAAPIS
jgi:predicted MFS family arabinose efflux permease